MISKDSISQILNSARIEEVIGEFVTLKKRGANLIGLCPFHNEKTPSFYVSPSKNIFKCFGCGKAGNAVTFLMEHEHYSFPEALGFLAEKYNIVIEQSNHEPEGKEMELERESLFIINDFARKFFSSYLTTTDEGRSVGMTYFHERGFTSQTIEKFQLGMAPDSWSALLESARLKGYSEEFLIKAGLLIEKETGEGKDNRLFDRFRNRVIFPIHNLSGKVIAFGARLLAQDQKSPKYLNSPETEIYHKSKILYGIYFAKKQIIENDECYLAEGYTDVISLFQNGIENVVASSGTSLTTDQIRLIARYTSNVTILYDGDEAGIKASLRGIDMILEQGMNVRVVLLPQGEDPDSFAKNHSHSEIIDYIKTHKKDFITFKTGLLLKGSSTDPLARAGLIREVVESISKIPDAIVRETYIRQCSSILQVSEQTLIFEINKNLRRQIDKNVTSHLTSESESESPSKFNHDIQSLEIADSTQQEKEIIRLLLNYFDHPVSVRYDNGQESQSFEGSIGDYMFSQLHPEEFRFDDPILHKMFTLIFEQGTAFNAALFSGHEDIEIRQLAAELMTDRYQLHDWERTGVYVRTETDVLANQVIRTIVAFKIRKLIMRIKENNDQIRQAISNEKDITDLLAERQSLEETKLELTKSLGIVILK